jgi:hypothetical protein
MEATFAGLFGVQAALFIDGVRHAVEVAYFAYARLGRALADIAECQTCAVASNSKSIDDAYKPIREF